MEENLLISLWQMVIINKSFLTFKETSNNYLNRDFIWDVIPLIPLQLMNLNRNRERIFYAIKMIRIRTFSISFGKEHVMKWAKETQM